MKCRTFSNVPLEEIEKLYDFMQASSSTIGCTALSRVLFLNENTLKEHILPIKKIVKFSTEYSDYSKQKYACALKFADKDERKNSIVESRDKFGITFRIIENEKEYNEAMDELDETFKDAIEEWETQSDTYYKKIKEQVDIKLFQLSLEDLPPDLNFNTFKRIKMLIYNIEG